MKIIESFFRRVKICVFSFFAGIIWFIFLKESMGHYANHNRRAFSFCVFGATMPCLGFIMARELFSLTIMVSLLLGIVCYLLVGLFASIISRNKFADFFDVVMRRVC